MVDYIAFHLLYKVLEYTQELKQKLKEEIRNRSYLTKDGSFGKDKVCNQVTLFLISFLIMLLSELHSSLKISSR